VDSLGCFAAEGVKFVKKHAFLGRSFRLPKTQQRLNQTYEV